MTNHGTSKWSVEEHQNRIVRAWGTLHRAAEMVLDVVVQLEGLNIRLPKQPGAEVLIVLKGSHEDGTPMVAFMSGDFVATALDKAMLAYADGSLKWRIDEWRIDNA